MRQNRQDTDLKYAFLELDIHGLFLDTRDRPVPAEVLSDFYAGIPDIPERVGAGQVRVNCLTQYLA